MSCSADAYAYKQHDPFVPEQCSVDMERLFRLSGIRNLVIEEGIS